MVCHHLCSTPGQETETYDGLQGDGRWLALCNNNGHTAPAWYQRLFQDEVHIRHLFTPRFPCSIHLVLLKTNDISGIIPFLQ